MDSFMATVNKQSSDTTMLAVRLHGPSDMRVERLPRPGKPGPGQVLLRVTAVGVCGSEIGRAHV